LETVASKTQILQEAGYGYNFDRMVYYNRQTKKAFSIEFVEDHSESELLKCIGEQSNGAGWKFYFNSSPPPAVARDLENVLG
jgi:hypothetical protein